MSRRADKLQGILDAARAMTLQQDFDRLVELILSAAAQVVDADRFSLFFVDQEKKELWTRGADGKGRISLPFSSGIVGRAAAGGQVINVKDAAEVDQATGYRTTTVLCVPMCGTTGEVACVLEAVNRRQGEFTQEDEELLLALGGQAAASLENVLLHEETGRLVEGFVGAVLDIESREAGQSKRLAALAAELETLGGHFDQVRTRSEAIQKAEAESWKSRIAPQEFPAFRDEEAGSAAPESPPPESVALARPRPKRTGLRWVIALLLVVGAIAGGFAVVPVVRSHLHPLPDQSELSLVYPYGFQGARGARGERAPGAKDVRFELVGEDVPCAGYSSCLRYRYWRDSFEGTMVVGRQPDGNWERVGDTGMPFRPLR